RARARGIHPTVRHALPAPRTDAPRNTGPPFLLHGEFSDLQRRRVYKGIITHAPNLATRGTRPPLPLKPRTPSQAAKMYDSPSARPHARICARISARAPGAPTATMTKRSVRLT